MKRYTGRMFQVRFTRWRRLAQQHGHHSVQAYNQWQKVIEARDGLRQQENQ